MINYQELEAMANKFNNLGVQEVQIKVKSEDYNALQSGLDFAIKGIFSGSSTEVSVEAKQEPSAKQMYGFAIQEVKFTIFS